MIKNKTLRHSSNNTLGRKLHGQKSSYPLVVFASSGPRQYGTLLATSTFARVLNSFAIVQCFLGHEEQVLSNMSDKMTM